MTDSAPQEVPAPDNAESSTFRFTTIFKAAAVVAIFLCIAILWNVGLAILFGLLAFSVIQLGRRTPETRKLAKVFYSCVACVSILGAICSLSNRPIGLFVLSNVHYYYYDGKPIVLDEMWIHPEIEGDSVFFCLPPLVVYRAEGPPYKVGLSIVDYDNKNKLEKVQITSLVMTHAGKSHTIVHEGDRIESTFDTYVSGSAHVKYECLTDTGEWLLANNQSPIRIEMTFIIHKSDGEIESQIDTTMRPSADVGWHLLGSP